MKNYGMVLLLLVSLTGFSQTEKSLLWKISGNGLKEASYLYGTIHIACDATLDKATLDALDKTRQLYLEIDMDDPDMQTSMIGGMMMKDGQRMSTLVSADDFKLLDAYMKEKTGVSAELMNTMKPFMISSLFLPALLDCPMQSVESALMEVTKAQNEETYGLETVGEQLAVFDAIPYQVQMDELMKSVKDKFVADKAEMAKMYDVYKSKDIMAMLAMTQESDNAITSDFQDILLNNRNKNWISKITSIARKTPTFFGVGAGHLAGENGVIMLLRKQGFKVEAVF